MWIRLAAGLLACTTGVAWAGAEAGTSVEGLRTFLRSVVDGEARSPRHFSHELPLLRDRSGRGSVLPTLTLVAGKLGDDRCVYQLRVETWTSDGERADHGARESTGGRSTLKQAPCETLVEEVLAVVEYEVGSLRRRVLHGAPRANNQARDAVVAAVRENAAPVVAAGAAPIIARTLPSRVNLRAAPSLTAPVRATLAPSTQLELLPTVQPGWYALRNGRGYVHERALQSLSPDSPGQPPQRARDEGMAVAGDTTGLLRLRP